MIAFTRAPSPHLARCELTHLPRQPIDLGRARAEHEAYEATLRDLGVEVRRITPAPEYPDGVFVEDVAVVLDELAILTRPGAPSRRGEVEDMAAALAAYRRLARVPPPGTLDGGDVLRDGRTVYVGASERTSPAAHAWLRERLTPLGYEVRVVAVTGCLHLKTAVTCPGPGTFLLNPEWVSPGAFAGRVLEVDRGEPRAANVLRVGDRVVAADGAPRTRARLEAELGLEVIVVDVTELARAEAGVTCCSVILAPVPDRSPAAGVGDILDGTRMEEER